jgi:hypothetical protein
VPPSTTLTRQGFRLLLWLIVIAVPVFSQGIPVPASGTISLTCRVADAVYQSGAIFVDGIEVGKCPNAVIQTSTGVHSLRAGKALGNDRYLAYQNERVEVQKDSTQNINANLEVVSTGNAAGLAYALGAKRIAISHLNRPDDSKIQALSPDGQTLAAGAETNSIRLYDASRGEPLARLGEPGEYWVSFVTAIAFSADGSMLAGNGWQRNKFSGEINIWDVRTRQLALTISNLKEVHALVFSPDGKLLAAGVGLNEVRVWSVTGGRLLWTLTAPGLKDKKISQLIFSSDGKLLVAGPDVGEDISVYEVRTAKHRRGLRGNLVTMGKDGIAYTFSYRGPTNTLLSTWKLSTGEMIESKLLRNTSAARAINEQVVAAKTRSENVLDPRNERLMQALENPACIVLSPDGRRLLLVTGAGSILSLPVFPGAEDGSVPVPIPTVTLCEMISHPEQYFDKQVRLVAQYQMATEGAYLVDERCLPGHDQQIGIGHPQMIDDRQRDRLNALRTISSHEYGGRAMVTVSGMLRNISRHDFVWYQYRFDIQEVEKIDPVILAYEGELRAGMTYRATVSSDRDLGLELAPAPRINENHAMRIDWINLHEFPELSKAGQHRILFTVFSDEIKQITERRWNRSLRCKILRIE